MTVPASVEPSRTKTSRETATGPYAYRMGLLGAVAGSPSSYRLMLKWHRLISPIERLLRRASRGRLGVLELAGLPSLNLTVPGRKSGMPRTVTVQYVADDPSLLVVGSNWGLAKHPEWARNLAATDHARIDRNGHRETVTVELLTGAERQRAWRTILDFWPNYALAQKRAGSRRFQIFALRPTAGA
ncbi:deazaflavin-dependent nitroreductase family protein [Mycolicibacterium conceptionense]|uniref:Deazaflavin-dependent nitroreductase family protein n=2 Tax=Mycolicibacterium conceptionense TaxID=451644 RepID=A0A0U1DA92_9MYCO|nr:deazaflavin-dependent nitroreductase family protein [Mycolicibacterium conceptionense]